MWFIPWSLADRMLSVLTTLWICSRLIVKILLQMNVRTYCDILIWRCMLYCHIVVLLYCDIVVLHIVLSCWWCSYCYLLCCCPLMILFILPNISGHALVHNGTERMLACRTQTSGWDIRCYCFWWGVWWESTQLDANFLGNVWLGTYHTKHYMHNMQQRYCKGRTIQQTPVAISRITSWGNPDEPEVLT